MNKTELITEISEKMGVSKVLTKYFIDTFTEVVTNEIANASEVKVYGLGKFALSKRAARKGVNPQNPSEKIDIPARNVPTFKASKTLKEAVN